MFASAFGAAGVGGGDPQALFCEANPLLGSCLVGILFLMIASTSGSRYGNSTTASSGGRGTLRCPLGAKRSPPGRRGFSFALADGPKPEQLGGKGPPIAKDGAQNVYVGSCLVQGVH